VTLPEDCACTDDPFNVAGFPAISIPVPVGDGGLPAALQIVARPGDDGALLQIAQQIE
jgi:aspartyl-tRNA(Asn)/glutamyl-tRNA(Gln) amidotransferase subunit A